MLNNYYDIPERFKELKKNQKLDTWPKPKTIFPKSLHPFQSLRRIHTISPKCGGGYYQRNVPPNVLWNKKLTVPPFLPAIISNGDHVVFTWKGA